MGVPGQISGIKGFLAFFNGIKESSFFHKGISGLPLDVKPLLELNLGHNQSHTQTNSQKISPAALMIALPLLIQVKVPLSIEA